MAIDTAERRKSISGIQWTLIPGVTPNAAQDREWRQEADWGYPGILVGAGEEPPPPVVEEGEVGTGHRRRRREHWSLTFEDETYVFDSLDALIAFLSAQEEKEVERAEVTAEKDAKRIVLVGREKVEPKPPLFKVKSAVAEIVDYAADVQAKVDRVYWKALAVALARQVEEDEDMDFIASIM